MSDFDDNWNISGLPNEFASNHEAEPVQPAQTQPQQPVAPAQQVVQPQQQAVPTQMFAQPQMQPQYYQPAQPQYVQPVQPMTPQYVQPVQAPVQPQYIQPQYPQPGMPVQPQMGNAFAYPYHNTAYLQDALAERNANIEEINKMINHFSPKLSLFQEYEDCCAKMRSYLNPNVAPLIFGSIIGLICILMIILTIGSKNKQTTTIYLIASFATALISAGLFVLFFLTKRKYAAKLENVFARIGEISNQLQVLYNGFGGSSVPPELSDPRVLFKIRYLMVTGKSLTIKDAITSLLFKYKQGYNSIEEERKVFSQVTSEKLDGNPAFFNAIRFIDVR